MRSGGLGAGDTASGDTRRFLVNLDDSPARDAASGLAHFLLAMPPGGWPTTRLDGKLEWMSISRTGSWAVARKTDERICERAPSRALCFPSRNSQ